VERLGTLLLGVLGLVIGLAAAELGARLYLGRPGAAAIQEELMAAAVVPVRGGPRRDRNVRTMVGVGEVVHPYLGWVVAPPDSVAPGEWQMRELGLALGGRLVRELRSDELVVGVFGGSLAGWFPMEPNPQRMIDGLRLRVFSAGLAGFKQPQSLFALSYLLTLGARFDLVLLIDGFNEVALPLAENVAEGVFPVFPRGWPARVADLDAATEVRTAIGEIAFLERRRSERAIALLESPLRRSRLAFLVWRLGDRSLAAQLAARRADLASPEARAHASYAMRGPRWPHTDPALLTQDLVDVWREASLQMSALCERYGIRFHHFLQPNQYVPDSKPMGAGERRVAIFEGHPYATFVPEAYPRLRAAGAELRAAGVRFHDLSDVFHDVEEPVYVDSCCHVGARGNEILADAIARAILADEREAPPAPEPPNGARAASP
jgi:hypothetical protein